MKKFIAIILSTAIIMGMLVAFPVFAEENTTYQKDSAIKATLVMPSVDAIVGSEGKLTYDSTKLTYRADSFKAPNISGIKYNTDEAGKITFNFSSIDPYDISADHIIISAEFIVLEDTTAEAISAEIDDAYLLAESSDPFITLDTSCRVDIEVLPYTPDTSESSSSEQNSSESGSSENSSESGSSEQGSSESTTSESTTSESATSESATSESTTSESSTSESGTSEQDTSESASSEAGSSETAPATTITLKAAKTKITVGSSTLVKATVKNGKGTTTYTSSNKKIATVSTSGKVKGIKAGKVIISAKNNGVTAKLKITVVKKTNTMTVKAKVVSVKASANKTVFKKAKAFTIKKAKGAVSFKITKGSKKVTINKKTGTVTVKKGLVKGKTYKVKVNVKAKGTSKYKTKSKTVTFKIKVK